MKQKFCYSVLRACKLYTDDHYQRQRKMSYRSSVTELWYVLQNFFLTHHFSTVLPLERSRPSTPRIAQEPTGSFPRPSFLAPWSQSVFPVHQRTDNSKMLVFRQAVFLVPSPTPFPPIFLLLLNLFNMAPEIEFSAFSQDCQLRRLLKIKIRDAEPLPLVQTKAQAQEGGGIF